MLCYLGVGLGLVSFQVFFLGVIFVKEDVCEISNRDL